MNRILKLLTVFFFISGSIIHAIPIAWDQEGATLSWCDPNNWLPPTPPITGGSEALFEEEAFANKAPEVSLCSPFGSIIVGIITVDSISQKIGSNFSGIISMDNGGTAKIELNNSSSSRKTTTFNIEKLIPIDPIDIITAPNTILQLNGILDGSGDVSKTGVGEFALNSTGTNTYSGTITVSEGDFSLFVDSVAPGLLGSVTVSGVGKFIVGGGRSVGGTVTLDTGIISLIGQNNFTGGFAFNSGILTVQEGPVILTTTTTIGGSVFIDSDTDNALTINGTISETGAHLITKTGRNSLILAGTCTLPTSIITISEGTIAVNAPLTASSFSVPTGGTLGGTGPITAPITVSGGAIAPGNSIATLNIIGAVSLSSDSTLLNEISSTPGETDLLNVTGALTIDPGATLLVDPRLGVYLPGSTYTVATASGGVSMAFDTLNFTAPGFTGTNSLVGSSIILTIDVGSHVFLHLFTNDHNPEQVALCFNGQPIDSGGDFETVAIALQPLENSPKAMENALDQMQPAIFGSLNLIQESQMTLVQSTFSHRLQAWGNCTYGDLTPNTWTLWVKPIGQFIGQDSHGEQAGFNTQAYGGMIGTDRTFYNYLHLGIATGYVYNNVNWKRSRGTAHSHNFYGAAYAAWQRSNFHVLASFVGGWNGYHGERFIKFSNLNRKATHNNSGYVLGTHIEGSYSHIKKGTRLQPFGKFEYTYSTQDDYKESGANSLNLRVQRKSSDRIRTDVGLDLSHCFKTNCGQFIPNAYVSWVYEKELKSGIMKARFNTFNCSMNLHALRPVRSIFAPGAGITGVFFTYRLSLALRWDGEFAKRYSNQKALIEATFGF